MDKSVCTLCSLDVNEAFRSGMPEKPYRNVKGGLSFFVLRDSHLSYQDPCQRQNWRVCPHCNYLSNLHVKIGTAVASV